MNKELIRAAIAALRSGTYNQTTRELKRGNCFCFLGVLADVTIKTGTFQGWWAEDIFCIKQNHYVRPSPHSTTLPQFLISSYGLNKQVETETGEIWQLDQLLIDRNDQGWTFEQLANLYEQHVGE